MNGVAGGLLGSSSCESRFEERDAFLSLRRWVDGFGWVNSPISTFGYIWLLGIKIFKDRINFIGGFFFIIFYWKELWLPNN